MEPLTLLINPPKSKRKAQKRAKRKAKRRFSNPPRRPKARKPSPPATQKGPNVAKKQKKAARRKSSGKRRRRSPGGFLALRGGGGGGGFLSKFTPESPVMLGAGAATGIVASTVGVDLLANQLPPEMTQNRIFRPATQVIIGGIGYWGTKRWSRSFAMGHFGGCVGTAVYELVGPYIVDAIRNNMGQPSLSGGAYQAPGSGFAPGENGNTVLALAGNQNGQLGSYAGWAVRDRQAGRMSSAG